MDNSSRTGSVLRISVSYLTLLYDKNNDDNNLIEDSSLRHRCRHLANTTKHDVVEVSTQSFSLVSLEPSMIIFKPMQN